MINSFCEVPSSLIFLFDWLPSEPKLSTLVYINEQKILKKNSTKFKLESFYSASKLLTITP